MPRTSLLLVDLAPRLLAHDLAQFSTVAEPPARTATPPDPHRISFRAGDSSPSAVDSAAGTIRGVSLLTADREAGGHGVWIDGRTLESFLALQSGRRIKAYATHGSWGKDGTLDEVGYWENPKIDGKQLRADFASLAAWKKHRPDEFDTLFELAEKLPAEFGASLSFRFKLAWVMGDGREVETVRKYRYSSDRGYETFFDPPKPVGALRDLPSVRATEVYSADFVDQPAANDGLFRSGQVDAPGSGISPAQNQTAFAMLKELYAKFAANPTQLAAAIKLHTENDKLTFAEVVSKIETEAKEAELLSLRDAVAKKDGELADFAKQLKAKDDEIAALKADVKKKEDAIAALKKSGADHVPTGDGDETPGGTIPEQIAALRDKRSKVTGSVEEIAAMRGKITAEIKALEKKLKS